jgi:hypothetical protein
LFVTIIDTKHQCHPREGGDPETIGVDRFFVFWIPAFAGMTNESLEKMRYIGNTPRFLKRQGTR